MLILVVKMISICMISRPIYLSAWEIYQQAKIITKHVLYSSQRACNAFTESEIDAWDIVRPELQTPGMMNRWQQNIFWTAFLPF